MKNALFIVLFLLNCLGFSQHDFTWPIDKVNITGNYGEVRPNHFHAGIDFSTNGEENLPVYSVDDGYIARIKVSAFGYGKVLYIAHPDGKLTVYAHQNRFNDAINAYVKAEQLRQRSFEVELFPKENELKVKRGEIIGFSGNTGGSTGPHLHFELRNDLTEIPVNPLLYYHLPDTVKPGLNGLAIYDVSDTLKSILLGSYKVISKKDSLYLKNDSIVLPNSILGIAFSGDDKSIVNGNPNNIYDVKLVLDSSLIYHHQLNYITFDNARYVNEYSDNIAGLKYQKCFVPKVYPFAMYKTLNNKGRIILNDTLFHKVKFILTDEGGMKNEMTFFVKARHISTYRSLDTKGKCFLNCTNTFTYSAKNFDIEIPAKSLFSDAFLDIRNVKSNLFIGPDNAPFRQSGTIRFKLTRKFLLDSGRVVLRNNGSIQLPKIKNGVAEFSFKNFGNFDLALDTIGPKIKPKTPLKKLKTLIKKADKLTFIITDNLSGIASYYLYINDQWRLAEYDGKSDQLIYYFDNETPVGEMNIRLEVKDRVGNKSLYSLKLKR